MNIKENPSIIYLTHWQQSIDHSSLVLDLISTKAHTFFCPIECSSPALPCVLASSSVDEAAADNLYEYEVGC